MDSEQRRIKKLYNQFKKDLAEGDIPTDYDENDLVDIYDYATDNSDEYVRLSVLLSAARIYPTSEELTQRRGYYFYDHVACTEGAFDLASSHKTDSALWAILWEMLLPADKRSEADFDIILSRFSNFDDETIIQLIDACSYLEMYDWLKRHKTDIQRRSVYPDTFLNELSQEAFDQGDYSYAVEILEELTGMVPFNVSYWLLLSESYLRLNDYDNALTSVDYALAIDAKSSKALIQKATVLNNIAGGKQEAVNIVGKVLEETPFDLDALYLYTYILERTPQKRIAAELLLHYIHQVPDNRDFVDHLLPLQESDLSLQGLEEHYRVGDQSEGYWVAWAKEYYSIGEYSQCADILSTYVSHNHELLDWSMLMESLYKLKRYSEIVTMFIQYIEGKEIVMIGLSMLELLILVMSAARCGDWTRALELADVAMNLRLSDIGDYTRRMIVTGVQRSIEEVLPYINDRKPVDWDAIDPLMR